MINETLPTEQDLQTLVKNRVLISSAVTMAPEDYIKKSATDFVFSHLLLHTNIVEVDENPDNLKKSMLTSSISEEDAVMLLHGCVSRKMGLHVAEKKELTEEEAKEKEEEENQVMSSFTNSIDMIKNSMGTCRASIGSDVDGNIICFNITKPLTLNIDAITFDGDSQLDILGFLDNILACDAGMTMSLEVPISILSNTIKDVINVSDSVANWAVETSAKAKYNDTFTEIFDPWKMFGEGIL